MTGTAGRSPVTADDRAGDTGTVIECEQVSCHYGRTPGPPGRDRDGDRDGDGPAVVRAVTGVSATVPAGARVALTGPSGSGKSTLLHLMAGLVGPTDGRVRWPGIGDHPAERPGAIGVVFQGPSLVPELTAAENVELPLVFADELDEPGRARRAASALAAVGITELAAKLPDELSGGQAQRVAVARALAPRPRVILADEPTGALDRDAGERVVTALLTAADDLGAALVVATHDPSVAGRLTTTWSMRDGRLVSCSPNGVSS